MSDHFPHIAEPGEIYGDDRTSALRHLQKMLADNVLASRLLGHLMMHVDYDIATLSLRANAAEGYIRNHFEGVVFPDGKSAWVVRGRLQYSLGSQEAV